MTLPPDIRIRIGARVMFHDELPPEAWPVECGGRTKTEKAEVGLWNDERRGRLRCGRIAVLSRGMRHGDPRRDRIWRPEPKTKPKFSGGSLSGHTCAGTTRPGHPCPHPVRREGGLCWHHWDGPRCRQCRAPLHQNSCKEYCVTHEHLAEERKQEREKARELIDREITRRTASQWRAEFRRLRAEADHQVTQGVER